MGDDNHDRRSAGASTSASSSGAARAAQFRGQVVADTVAGCFARDVFVAARRRDENNAKDDAKRSSSSVFVVGGGGGFAAPSVGEEQFYGHMLSGAIAGTTEHCAMFPLDTIKTRMQTAAGGAAAARAAAASGATSGGAAAVAASAYQQTAPRAVVGGAMRDVAGSLMRTEGIAGLYRGVAAVGIGAGPAHAVYFATYEYAKDALGGGKPGHHPLSHAAAGICATILGREAPPKNKILKNTIINRSPHIFFFSFQIFPRTSPRCRGFSPVLSSVRPFMYTWHT